MLNILKKKQKNSNYISLNDNKQEKNNLQDNFNENEHKNIIFHPSSSKE